MKITNTPDLLVIDKRPWIIGLLLIGVIFGLLTSSVLSLLSGSVWGTLAPLPVVAFVGFFFWAFVRRSQLLLNAVDRTATLRNRTMSNYTEVVHDLDHLSGAILETSGGSDGDVYRMTLQIKAGMDEGLHPFTESYSSGPNANKAVEAVNTWLARLRA